jgi:hypothetical protein
MPGVRAATASGELLFGETNAAFWRAVGCGLHGLGVGRTDFVVVMNVLRKDRPFDERGDHLRQKQIRHGTQLIAGCGVSGNINAKAAELLNEAPDFRAAGADLAGDFSTADNHGGVIHEKLHDAAQVDIGGRVRELQIASFLRCADGENYNESFVVSPRSLGKAPHGKNRQGQGKTRDHIRVPNDQ